MTGAARLGASATVVAVATASLAVLLVEPRLTAAAAAAGAAFVVATTVAAVRPTAVAAPVLAGTALAWPVALGDHGPAFVVPVLGGIVLVAELVGASGEHRGVVVKDPASGQRHAVLAAAVGAGAAGAVALATAGPTTTGVAGTVVAGVAVAVGVLLALPDRAPDS